MAAMTAGGQGWTELREQIAAAIAALEGIIMAADAQEDVMRDMEDLRMTLIVLGGMVDMTAGEDHMTDYVVSGSLDRLGPHKPWTWRSPPAKEWQAADRELGKPVRLRAESPRAAAKAWAEGSIAGDLEPGTIFTAYVVGGGSFCMIVADPPPSDPEVP